MMSDFVSNAAQLVLAAYERVRIHVLRTPLMFSSVLSSEVAANVYLKLESEQHTNSFKVRGVFNKILSMSHDDLLRGIVTASTGNHGLAFAFAQKALHGVLMPVHAPGAVLYLPTNTSLVKKEALQAGGSGGRLTIHCSGGDCTETEREARLFADREHRTFISPYNDYQVMAGQGTVAVELLEQCPNLDVVYIPVGGGGLISGMAAFIKKQRPFVCVVGCSPSNSPIMAASVEARRIVSMESLPTLSDGTAGGMEPGSATLEPCVKCVDRWMEVTEDEIRNAMLLLLRHHRKLVEGAAAMAVACMLKDKNRLAGKTVGVVVCGGNVGMDTLRDILSFSSLADAAATVVDIAGGGANNSNAPLLSSSVIASATQPIHGAGTGGVFAATTGLTLKDLQSKIPHRYRCKAFSSSHDLKFGLRLNTGWSHEIVRNSRIPNMQVIMQDQGNTSEDGSSLLNLDGIPESETKRRKKMVGEKARQLKCVLCSTDVTRHCSVCTVPLCTFVSTASSAYSRSCWQTWHTDSEIAVCKRPPDRA